MSNELERRYSFSEFQQISTPSVLVYIGLHVERKVEPFPASQNKLFTCGVLSPVHLRLYVAAVHELY